MKIWRQNLVAIVPLFACLALAISGLVYHFVKRELVKGLQEEAAAAATAVAAFSAVAIDGAVVDEKARARMGEAIGRALAHGSLLRVTIVRGSRAQQETFLDLGDQQIFPPAGAPARVGTEPFRTEAGKTVVAARAPVVSPDSGKRTGEVVACMNAQRLPEGLAAIWQICAIGSLFTIAAGAVASTLVSRELSAEIAPLHGALAEVGNAVGVASAKSARGSAKGIREIVDLRNTVDTMASVLQWTLHKTRLLAEGESGQSLQGHLKESHTDPLQEQHAWSDEVALHVMPVDERSAPAAFLGAWRTASGEVCGFFGRVRKRNDAESERVLASSAELYLRQRLCQGNGPHASVVRRAAPLFELADVCVLRCPPDASRVDVIRLAAGGLSEESHCIGAGEMRLFHNGGARSEHIAEGLARTLPSMRPDALAQRAASLMAAEEGEARGLMVAALTCSILNAPPAAESGFSDQYSPPALSTHA